MSSVVLGDTLRISVTFRDWTDAQETGGAIDPSSVTGEILDEHLVQIGSFTPTHAGLGTYQYVWTATPLGITNVQFTGTFTGGRIDEVRESFVVTASGTSVGPTVTLGQDQFLSFMPQVSPVYIDPEEILTIYPDASPVEINDLIYVYSLEVDEFLQGKPKTTLAYDYIKAATCCSLSRTYDLSDADISSFQLGDLSVTQRSFPKARVSRGTANTWCEFAAALRMELQRKWYLPGMTTVVRGDKLFDPIPVRDLDFKELA